MKVWEIDVRALKYSAIINVIIRIWDVCKTIHCD